MDECRAEDRSWSRKAPPIKFWVSRVQVEQETASQTASRQINDQKWSDIWMDMGKVLEMSR